MDIEKLAREAGFSVEDCGAINDGIETAADFSEELRRFAALVAEEAAKVCDEKMHDYPRHFDLWIALECAAAIRERFKAS